MSSLARKPKVRLIDKSVLAIRPVEPVRKPDAWFRSKDHRDWINKQPCMACGRIPVEAAHIRKGTDGCSGEKPSDFYVVPLCDSNAAVGYLGCHDRQHGAGEITFWGPLGGVERGIQTALDFATRSPCERTRKAAAAVLAGKDWRDAA